MPSLPRFITSSRIVCTALVLFILAVCSATAQVKVKGVVRDDNTGETMIGAAVLIKGTTIGGVTDVDGRFEFISPDSPPFTLVVSFLGYTSQEVEIRSLSDKISIGLSTDEVLMEEVEVIGERISQKQKESPLTVESMDVLAIKETASSDFYEGIGQLKGVDLTVASIGFKVVNTRGFNSTSPVRSLQIIDGVDNQSPGLNFSLGNFLGASELDVMKLDIIQGASSAYFGPNAFNGVISMTTKNPFQFPGLAVAVKYGERGLFHTGFRFAQVLKNKRGEDKFAYKINWSYMQANDWEATNMDTASGSLVGIDNPGWYDAVNRYGDENLSDSRNNASSITGQINSPGLGVWHRTGYEEADLVDYDSRNTKLGLAMHYRVKPDVELICSSNFGTGTTVYQGDNRYSLKDILFIQNRLELNKKDKYFLRVYATNEDAGNSYDAVFTAFLLQDAAKDGDQWSTDYRNYWNNNILQKSGPLLDLKDFPVYVYPASVMDWLDEANAVMDLYPDSLEAWHAKARNAADTKGGTSFYQPGTAEFDSAFASITSLPLSKGGTRFIDNSALYHAHGEYKFTPAFMDIVVGGNFRMYRPVSHGTIFSDTGDVVITNSEYGAYCGLEKKFFDDKFKVNLTSRVDKNVNFDYLWSPAASVVYSPNRANVIRLSMSSAIRNPTLADQYLYYNVGRAVLVGNIEGFDSLVTVPSVISFLNGGNNKDSLEYFNVAPVRPEKVKSVEIGYRTTLFKQLYLDAGYYFSWYNDFLGYNLGIDVDVDSIGFLQRAQAYRVAANARDRVTTQGFSIGINYFFKKYYAINGNYSWNVLDLRGSDDPIIPAFNTPEHKFNVGISGREVKAKIELLNRMWGRLPVISLRNWGFSLNYKWIEGFLFEGSPQFTGFVDTYDLVDMQINKQVPKLHMTFKAGASNLLNKKRFQAYGGPRIGRLAYFSVLFEL